MLIIIYSHSNDFLRRHEEAIIAEGHYCLLSESTDELIDLIQSHPADIVYLHTASSNDKCKTLLSRLTSLEYSPLIFSCINLNDEEVIDGQEYTGLNGLIMTCNEDPRAVISHLKTLQGVVQNSATNNHEQDSMPVTPKVLANNKDSLSWQISCYADIHTIRDNDVLEKISRAIKNFNIVTEHRRNLMIILSELYNNAVDHGLLRLPSELKQGVEGFSRFYELRLNQLQKLKTGFIDIVISQSVVNDKVELSISIKDSGKGFDYDNLLKNEMTDAPYGRGLIIVNKLCKSLEYRGNGNELTMIYEWPA